MKTTYLCGSPWLPDAVPVLGRDHGAERAQPLCPHCPACQATSLEVPSAATVSPEATSTMAKWEGEEGGREENVGGSEGEGGAGGEGEGGGGGQEEVGEDGGAGAGE